MPRMHARCCVSTPETKGHPSATETHPNSPAVRAQQTDLMRFYTQKDEVEALSPQAKYFMLSEHQSLGSAEPFLTSQTALQHASIGAGVQSVRWLQEKSSCFDHGLMKPEVQFYSSPCTHMHVVARKMFLCHERCFCATTHPLTLRLPPSTNCTSQSPLATNVEGKK